MLNNVIDISILVILFVALVCGGYRGAIRQVASLCGVVFGIVAGKLFYPLVGQWLLLLYQFPDWLFPVFPFLLIFIAVLLACTLAGNLLHQLFSAAGIGWLNRCVGAVLAVGKWTLLLSILINIIEITAVFNKNRTYMDKKEHSVLYNPVRRVAPTLFPYIPLTIEYARKEFAP